MRGDSYVNGVSLRRRLPAWAQLAQIRPGRALP